MAVRKICKQKGCRASPRCEHPWWFDVMHQGKRWRMPVDDFALPRGATEPITSKQTADRVWEPRFLGEIVAGGDPRVPPTTQQAAVGLSVAEFLDLYYTSYVEAEGLRSSATIHGRLKAAKRSLGDMPVTVLEKASEILRFKAEYRHGHQIATVNRALSTLRAAINWGRFQDPPVLSTSPFHRFGVSIKAKEETKRDRRIGLAEEQRLLATALEMSSAGHKYVGSSMHDRIVGALETCCRQGEMLRIQNRNVDWEQHQIAIPGSNAKNAENRRIPFDPHGRLAPILKRRAALGPNAFVFGSSSGGVHGQLQDGLGITAAARQRPRHETCEARGEGRSCEAPSDRSALA
jgi:integrase